MGSGTRRVPSRLQKSTKACKKRTVTFLNLQHGRGGSHNEKRYLAIEQLFSKQSLKNQFLDMTSDRLFEAACS